MSASVEAISKVEGGLAHAAAERELSRTSGPTCTSDPFQEVGDVASSSDGGLSWIPEALPANVPDPQLDGLSCPTATECWAAGSELVLEKLKRGSNAGSPMLIGTTNGGSTWSKVVFRVPSTAPNATGQSYISMGSATCPTVNLCLASGAAARGSGYAPLYSVVTANA
jgi:hypothetical protein